MKKLIACLGIVMTLGIIAGANIGRAPGPAAPAAPAHTAASSPRTPDTQAAATPGTRTAAASASSHSPVPSLTAPSPATPVRGVTRPTEIVAENGARYPLRTYQTLALPNDPGANQWWVNSTDLPGTWARGYGSYQTTVAVIDTGFALAHEDLAGRWASNTGEQGATNSQSPSLLNCTDRGLPLNASCNLIDDDYDRTVDNEIGSITTQNPSRRNCTDRGLTLDKACNLIDDDSNGYVDDVRGWDFASYDPSVQAGETRPNGPSTQHGSMVSGVLAATGNNGLGIAGVNWNTRILPLQSINDDGYGDTLTLSRAILYAVSRGVDIISLSLGADEEDPYLRQSVDYALAQGVMVVVAAGNDGCDCISYPARYPEVLAVGASNPTGAPASFSSYGSALDILAPGQSMTTLSWSAATPSSTYASGVAGTSFATPYTAGLLAQLKSLRPTATYAELVAALNETTDQTTLSQTNPWSHTRGYGITHAGRASERVTTPLSPYIRYQLGPSGGTTILDSSRVYDCQAATHPSTTLYELTKGSAKLYTISELTRYTRGLEGWTSRSMGHQCIGQSVDQPGTLRNINLYSETGNSLSKL